MTIYEFINGLEYHLWKRTSATAMTYKGTVRASNPREAAKLARGTWGQGLYQVRAAKWGPILLTQQPARAAVSCGSPCIDYLAELVREREQTGVWLDSGRRARVAV